MALKERYYTVDGQIVGYKKSGVRKDFLTDAFGSVTAEVDQTGNTKTFDGRYQPYGGTLSSSGSRGSFGWVGIWGYRDTSAFASNYYVRARHYSKTSGNWNTVDPIWPFQTSYQYGDGAPVSNIDPSGLDVISIGDACQPSPCDFLQKIDPKLLATIIKCMNDNGFDENGDNNRIRDAIAYMSKACKKDANGKTQIGVIDSDTGDNCGMYYDYVCKGGAKYGQTYTIGPPRNPSQPRGEGCTDRYKLDEGTPCFNEASTNGYKCIIGLCAGPQKCAVTAFHEMVHCARYAGATNHDSSPGYDDFVYNLGHCLCRAWELKENPGNPNFKNCGLGLHRPKPKT